MHGRITFSESPWPAGHAITALSWDARLTATGELWFDLDLQSDDYNSEDTEPDVGGEKLGWTNYGACQLSSTAWENTGFRAATPDSPLSFATLADRDFLIDPDPVHPDADPGDRPKHRTYYAFGVYLRGHECVSQSRIRFGPRRAGLTYGLQWHGVIATGYYDDRFDALTFSAHADEVTLDRIWIDPEVDPDDAPALLAGTVLDAADFALAFDERRNPRFVHRT